MLDILLGWVFDLMKLPASILPPMPARPAFMEGPISGFLGFANWYLPIDWMLNLAGVWGTYYAMKAMYRLWMTVKGPI